jgi:hypothetical protein
LKEKLRTNDLIHVTKLQRRIAKFEIIAKRDQDMSGAVRSRARLKNHNRAKNDQPPERTTKEASKQTLTSLHNVVARSSTL